MSPILNAAARRQFPLDIPTAATTASNGAAKTIDLSAHHGKFVMVQTSAKVHINGGLKGSVTAATVAMTYLEGGQREEFQVTPTRDVLSVIAPVGATAAVTVAETGE